MIAPGDELEPYVVAAVEPAHMRTMAALLDDPVPIHFDVEAVRRLGLGDRLVNQGPINAGYLLNAVIAWTGDAGAVRRFRCRLLGNVFAGERVECRGTVSAVDAERGVFEVDLRGDADGRPVLAGEATLALRP